LEALQNKDNSKGASIRSFKNRKTGKTEVVLFIDKEDEKKLRAMEKELVKARKKRRAVKKKLGFQKGTGVTVSKKKTSKKKK